MCRHDIDMPLWSFFLICFCVLILGMLMGGCAGNAPNNHADNLMVHLQCSMPCAFDVVVEEGHLKARVEEIVKANCSIHAGNKQITIACPADSWRWRAEPRHPYEYLAKHNATS